MSSRSGQKASECPPPPRRKPSVSGALYQISSMVGKVDDPDKALRRIIQVIAAACECDAAMVALVDPDTGSLRIEHALGYPSELGRAEIPSGLGLAGWVALHARPLLVSNVEEDTRHVAIRSDMQSAIILPLEIDGHLHGIVSLEKNTTHGFTERHLQHTIKLTREASRVLQQLWLMEHLRRKAGQFEVLSGMAHELTAKLEAGELLQSVTRDSVRLTGCCAATVQLYDRDRRTLALHAAFPAEVLGDAVSCQVPLEDCLSGTVIGTRKQIEFSNLQQPDYADLRDIPRQPAVKAVLSTPLLGDEDVTGVLSVYTLQPHRFSNDERRLLRALANLASVALQNARLYQRVFASEETLRQSERLTTLGLLAAEIAHETRNPLTVIRLLFGALGLEFDEADPRHTDVAIIREKLDQLEGFVGRVLTFAKAPETMHSRFAIDDIIRETTLLLRLKLNQAHIRLHHEAAPRPVVVDCNKGQVQQVLLNLLLNSVHAMPEGGTIRIETSIATDGPERMVRIDISDTGPGIPEAYRDQVFESFLSGRVGGTGLGLSIAKRIMRSHNGDIAIARTGADGTTMRITLPAAR